MMLKFTRMIFLMMCCASLMACVTSSGLTTQEQSNLQQGKRLFSDGNYKRSLRFLLPLATDGVAEAQYAVGYMYFYGYGVQQDADTGYFWIKRSADQHFAPAQNALKLIKRQGKDI